MNRRFSLFFIIAIFFCAQVFSDLHSGKSSFEEHDHNGEVCEICLSADYKKLRGNNASSFTVSNLLISEVNPTKKEVSILKITYSFQSRAPPFLF